jgi:hypothetical protein
MLRQYLGQATVIDVDVVEQIEMVRTGKRLQAISSIPLDLQSDQAELDLAVPK